MSDFTQFGGAPKGPNHLAAWSALTGVQLAQADPVWDFGWAPPPLAHLAAVRRTVSDAAPHLRGTWDGKTSFSLWDVGKRLQGAFLPAQRQTLGTCVSRGYSLALNLLQFTQMAAGARLEFKPVAHAPIYGGSRELAGILGPPGQDGSFGDAAARWVKEYGNAHLEEVADRYESDQLAGQMGWRGVPAAVKELCKDNLVGDTALVTSFAEAADMIWNGKPVPVCSGQGFTMERDADGFCRPQGSWAHCMCFGAVIVLPDGRRGLGCGQSWGDNTPSGPLLAGCPDYVFGVDEATAGRMLSGRDSFALAGLTGWAPQSWPLDWILWR